jgi:hypothetical protein
VTGVTDRPVASAQHASHRNPRRSKMMFKTNVGALDRGARIVAGLALLGLAVTGTVGAWGYIGLVPLATGLLGNCPLYSVFGFSTCPLKS